MKKHSETETRLAGHFPLLSLKYSVNQFLRTATKLLPELCPELICRSHVPFGVVHDKVQGIVCRVYRMFALSSNRMAFTMLELLVAIVLVSLAFTMIVITFGTVTRAWRRGMALTEDLHHGDFVMDQLVLALRSSYFPDAGGKVTDYGFWLEDDGSGASAHDSISWVKRGSALTATNSPTVAGPHRVKFSIEDNENGELAPAVRIWRPYAIPEDFDAAKIDPEFISGRICGFDCRVATNMTDDFGTPEWEWEDTWEEENTNRLPHAVELTLYLAPLEKGGETVELKRFVELPVAQLSWEPIKRETRRTRAVARARAAARARRRRALRYKRPSPK